MSKKNATTDRLKTMSSNSRHSMMRTAGRITKYGFIGFGRNIWLSLTSSLVMTLTLILLFVTVIASAVLSSTADVMRDKIDITIYFKPGTSETTLKSMSTTMKMDENVRSVSYSTSEQEYAKFMTETENSGDNELIATLNDDAMKEIMLKSMQATMRVKVFDADNLDSIKNIVSTDKEYTDNLDSTKEPTYDTNDTAISTISSWSNMARNGGLILSVVFLIVSILVIFNTIRMAIYSRSDEIYMEKLIGADNAFIRGPFIVEAMICGAIAGVISSTVGLIAFYVIKPKLASYDIKVDLVTRFLDDPFNKGIVFVVLIAIGCVIALVSSRLAVHKYLKRI